MTIPTCPHARRDKTRLTAQLQTLPHFTANASNPMLGKFIRALLRPIAAQYGLFVALLLRNTGSLSPYCYAIRALCRPIATQYGLRLRLCAHCVARIRLRYRPISRVALNTGSLSSRGCAPLTPGCILAPFQGALFPLAIFVTSAVGRCPFPPRHICHICRRQMSIPPRHICHICRRQMSIPPRHLWRGG